MESLVNAFLVGGVGVAIVNALTAGLKRRASAKGRRSTQLDAALRSRSVWSVYAYKLRNLLAKNDHEVPDLPDDPYEQYLMKEE